MGGVKTFLAPFRRRAVRGRTRFDRPRVICFRFWTYMRKATFFLKNKEVFVVDEGFELKINDP